MTEIELLSLVEAEEKRSLGYGNGELSADREKALDYYTPSPTATRSRDVRR